MKLGELSRRTGISIRMLRYYEAEGVLAPARTESGYRDYGQSDVETVRRIKALGSAGMTLPVIRQFLPCSLEGRSEFAPCDELRVLLRQQIALVEQRIATLTESRSVLAGLLSQLDATAR